MHNNRCRPRASRGDPGKNKFWIPAYAGMTMLLLLSLLSLSSCSFRPALAENSATCNLHSIEIEPIDSIEGAELIHYLSTIIPDSEKSKYRLQISFTYISSPLAIQKDSSVVRQSIALKINYLLKSKDTGELLTSGEFNNINSYDSTFSPYTSYDENDNALKDLLKNSALEIRNRLIFYFSNKNIATCHPGRRPSGSRKIIKSWIPDNCFTISEMTLTLLRKDNLFKEVVA